MPFGLDDAPLAVWYIPHLSMRLLEWKPQKASIEWTIRPGAVFAQSEVCLDSMEPHSTP
jgi:hypothetical protein